MSIFKSTFSPFVKTQLEVRQNAMVNRTPQNLQYINSRNAWIRMSSSVDVNGDKGALARKYILQGGTLNTDPNATNLNNVSKKQGIGDFSNAYSNQGTNGVKYQRGIRPIPGITSIDIKSKSAYGSLREVTVNFQCWDIQQLEDLEVLYMRPGYTVLIEWGWTPYLDNKGVYQSNFTDYYDIINKTTTDRTKLFRDLYEKSAKYGGNYDATFGYIKNYTWSARMDGGYDCTVNVISTGELIESLKLNYLSSVNITKAGLLSSEFKGGDETYSQWQNGYNYNVLAGVWKEAYYKLKNNIILSDSSSFKDYFSTDIFRFNTSNNDKNNITDNNTNVYITIESMFDILNKYIIAKSETDKKPLVELSVYATDYDGTTPKTPLTCIAHPLQISVDPRKCLIKNKIWDGVIRKAEQQVANSGAQTTAEGAYKLIEDSIKTPGLFSVGTNEENLLIAISTIAKSDSSLEVYNIVQDLIALNKPKGYSNLQEILNGELEGNNLKEARKIEELLEKIDGVQVDVKTTSGVVLGTFQTSTTFKSITITNSNQSNIGASLSTISQNAEGAIASLQFMDKIPLEYFNGDPFKEIGIIKHIYVNLNYLYQLALSSELESKDNQSKNEINIYNYVKQVMSSIQSAIGNINSFEIHVDPVDNNIARVIDINYTGEQNATYDALFPLQVHNLKSTVRTYSLQSQIFPEQGSIIAIGSQAQGGQMGIQNNTMIDFNANLIDRILTGKTDGLGIVLTPSIKRETYKITNGLANIISLFNVLDDEQNKPDSNNSQDYNTLELGAKNSLRDIIAYFQSITSSPGSNRNLIPTKFSCEMDGIGGLVIGHMFKLPDNVLPKGYRGEPGGIGSKLGNAITSIGHTISNNDWVTKIDSLNIVMDNPNSRKYLPLDISLLTLILEEQLQSETTIGYTAYTPQLGLDYANSTTFKSSPTESTNARKIAETYLGRKMSDAEWNQLIAATVAESGANENGKEDAYIVAVILNRTRNSNVTTILGGRNQFQSVTGLKNSGPVPLYKNGPNQLREKQIYKGIETYLPSINKGYKNFTSNNPYAYKSGTNIQTMYSYRANKFAVVIGGEKGTVFAIL